MSHFILKNLENYIRKIESLCSEVEEFTNDDFLIQYGYPHTLTKLLKDGKNKTLFLRLSDETYSIDINVYSPAYVVVIEKSLCYEIQNMDEVEFCLKYGRKYQDNNLFTDDLSTPIVIEIMTEVLSL